MRPEPADAFVYDPGEFYDEALASDGRPREHYAAVLAEIRELGPGSLRESAREAVASIGATFRVDDEQRPFVIDPVPRIIEAGEWEHLERGLAQRAEALNRYIADIYGRREIVSEGVVPERVAGRAQDLEGWMQGVEPAGCHAPVAGFDVVRDAAGELLVLEDNLRTPSGFAYMDAARRACSPLLPRSSARRREIGDFAAALGSTLRACAPDGRADPAIVLLSDGPSNSAWFEHRLLADRLGVPVVEPAGISVRGGIVHADTGAGAPTPVQVIYRRTDEHRLRDGDGRPTWLAELLYEPLCRGRVAVANCFGSGVGDDKLAHAYVDDMVRFYLGTEPLVRSVRTYDLAGEDARDEALRRRGELVFKPRAGQGGEGIVVGPHAEPRDRRAVGRLVRKTLDAYIAQETVWLSRHPTVCEGRLEPRHVDLRAFALATQDGFRVVAGALTRVAMGAGDLVVNSSQGGGAKDTWIL